MTIININIKEKKVSVRQQLADSTDFTFLEFGDKTGVFFNTLSSYGGNEDYSRWISSLGFNAMPNSIGSSVHMLKPNMILQELVYMSGKQNQPYMQPAGFNSNMRPDMGLLQHYQPVEETEYLTILTVSESLYKYLGQVMAKMDIDALCRNYLTGVAIQMALATASLLMMAAEEKAE